MLDIVRLPLRRTPSVHDPKAARLLARVCRDRGVSLVHAHSTKAGLLSALCSRISPVRSVYTPHSWAFERRDPLPLRVAYTSLEQVLVRRCHEVVITVSEAERDVALMRGVLGAGVDARVVRTGLPANAGSPHTQAGARARLGLPDVGHVVAWIGRAARQKRPQDLAHLARKLKGVATLVALGTGLAGSTAGEEARRAGAIVAADATDADLLYAAADVFVQTSAYEGLPLTVLEAMAAGLPVVAYAVGGVCEQVVHGKTGVLVAEIGAVDELAESIGRLLAEPGALKLAGEAAQAHLAAAFSYDRMLDELEEIYIAIGSNN